MLNFGGCKASNNQTWRSFWPRKILIEKMSNLSREIHLAILIRVQLGKRSLQSVGFFVLFCFAAWQQEIFDIFRNGHNWFLYKNCWYLNISAIRTCKNPMLSFHASNATKTDPHKFQEDPFIHPSWETIQRWLASGETPAWVKWRYALPQIERSNFGKGTTWKAKCPIFKALVAGFRGKAA